MNDTHAHHHDHGHVDGSIVATDPVCGMKVNPATTPHHATHEGKRIVLGNARFLSEQSVDTVSLASAADELRREGATAIFVGIDGQVGGAIASELSPLSADIELDCSRMR